MTGFAFTTFLVHQTQIPHRPADFSAAEIKTDNMVNRVYLVCKDFPMLVLKSAFAKCSGEHDKKLRKLGLIQETAETVWFFFNEKPTRLCRKLNFPSVIQPGFKLWLMLLLLKTMKRASFFIILATKRQRKGKNGKNFI